MDPNEMYHIFLPFILSIFVFSTSSRAEENPESWYQIEYILFEHLNSDRHVLRYEDVKYTPAKKAQYYYLTSNNNTASPFQLKDINESLSDFTDIFDRITNSNELRVDGKKKDDLQAVMQMIKDSKIGIPVQFINFRD